MAPFYRSLRHAVAAAGVTVLGAASGAVAQENERPTLPPALVDLVEAAGTPPRLGSPLDRLLRVAEILGEAPADSRLIRRLSAPRTPSDGLRVEVLPATVRGVSNSRYARTGNDGLLWTGRGVSTAMSAGVRLRWGPLSAAVAPEVAWVENADFEVQPVLLEGYSPLVYQYGYRPGVGIDYPQRMGEERLVRTGLGASHVRLDAFGAAVGFSTENMWWGPATRYPLVMSNTAPGFPHLFLGTSRPVSVGIGTIEAELSWGGLQESDHFDDFEGNDENTFVGLAVVFSPNILEGFSIGAGRAFRHLPTASSWIRDVEALEEPSNVHVGSEMFSLFARWVIKGAGEIYGEWGRHSTPRDLGDLIDPRSPGAGWVLGFQNVIGIRKELSLRMQGELADLERSTYFHGVVPQGHTHRGELLGAWIGPGNEAQYVGVDALMNLGTAGLYFERIYRAPHIRGNGYPPTDFDIEVTLGIRALTRSWNGMTVAADLSRSERWVDDPKVNWGLDLHAVWIPSRP